jgi:DNA-binding response OmpR family regulator
MRLHTYAGPVGGKRALYYGGCRGGAILDVKERTQDKLMSKDGARLVLVVEDDLSVRRPLVKFLEMHGFAVVTAETSDEGLEMLRKHTLVAAVVDLRLRRGSGRDVVVSTPADVPVIIFSGVPSESAELERLRPRTRLIEKPYSLVLLVETLEEMLSESNSQNLHP